MCLKTFQLVVPFLRAPSFLEVEQDWIILDLDLDLDLDLAR